MRNNQPSRQDIVDHARTWIGTPYLHQQRERGRFCDCVGLIIGVARHFGLGDYRKNDYLANPDPEHMGRRLRENLDEITPGAARVGDILWIAFKHRGRAVPVHLGIIGDYPGGGHSLIHAYSTCGCVTEHRLDRKWLRRVHSAFRYRGLVC